MRRVGAQDEGRLEEILAHLFGTPAIVLEVQVAATLAPGRLLVPKPEAQKRRRIIREEGLDCPLRSRSGRVLRPVVAEAQEPLRQLPMIEWLEPAVHVKSLAVARARLVSPVRISDDDVPEGQEVLAQKGEGRALPARRRVLVLGVEADDRAVPLLGCLPGRDRRAELDGAPLVEVEEGPQPARHQRVRDLVAAEGNVVLAVEDAAQQLEVEGQWGNPGCFDARLDQALFAEELLEDVWIIDEGPIVGVDLVEVAEPVAHLA